MHNKIYLNGLITIYLTVYLYIEIYRENNQARKGCESKSRQNTRSGAPMRLTVNADKFWLTTFLQPNQHPKVMACIPLDLINTAEKGCHVDWAANGPYMSSHMSTTWRG